MNHIERVQLPGDPTIAGANTAYLFSAPPDQRLNWNMYAHQAVSDPNTVAFYWRNNIQQPTSAEVVSAFNRSQGIRDNLKTFTTASAFAAAGVGLSPFASHAITACLANLQICGIQAAEIAAGDALGPSSVAGAFVLARRAGAKGVTSAEPANAEWLAESARNSAAWNPGSAVFSVDLAVGTRVRMIVDRQQLDLINDGNLDAMGRWATFDDLPHSLPQVRQQLALPERFKFTNRGVYVVEFEVTRTIPSRIGFVGPQAGGGTGGGVHPVDPSVLVGGGTQVLLPSTDRGSYFRRVGPAKCIGGC
jgi:hypothetical protein